MKLQCRLRMSGYTCVRCRITHLPLHGKRFYPTKSLFSRKKHKRILVLPRQYIRHSFTFFCPSNVMTCKFLLLAILLGFIDLLTYKCGINPFSMLQYVDGLRVSAFYHYIAVPVFRYILRKN